MDLLRDWLGPTIEQQLERVLHWKEQGSAGFPNSEKVTYEDDESNLRVRLKKVGSLQIVKFEGLEDPIKAVLSDSCTSIQATFASSTVRAFHTKYGKRITQDTKGGIIGISQYDIVATHLGPRQSSVTLLVQDLQFRGSEGSPTFGHPVPIQDRQRVGPLVRRLKELKSVEALDVPKDSERDGLPPSSPTRSQVESPGVGDGAYGADEHFTLATQVGFRSQMSRNKNLESTGANSIQPEKISLRPSEEAPSAPDRYGAPENAKRRKKNTEDDLLGLLRKPPQPRSLESRTGGPAIDLTKDGLAIDKPRSTSYDKPGLLAQSYSVPHSRLNRSAAQATSWGKMRVNDQRGAIEMLQQEASGVNGGEDLLVAPKVQSEFRVDTELSRKEESRLRTAKDSNAKVKHGSPQKPPDRQSQAVEKHRVHGQSSKNFSIGLSIENDNEEHFTEDPWNGVTRIRRRDTRISRDQENLLDHNDSWFPPQPGSRGPVSRVPHGILQALNAAAEQSDENTEPAEERQEALELGITGSQRAYPSTGSEAEEDSDEERLSGWSSSSLPSAPDDQPPPDSSFEASLPPERISRKNLLPDVTVADGEEREKSSPTAPPAQAPSHGLGEPLQIAQLESCDVSGSDNGALSQNPTPRTQPLLGQPKVPNTRSSESAARPENVISDSPTWNHTNDTAELKDALVTQTNQRDLNGNSVEEHLHKIFTPGRVGAAVKDSDGLHIHIPLRRSRSLDDSSEDDDLESQLPQALRDEKTEPDQKEVYGPVSPPLLPPSTAYQEEKSTLQVKRTPYNPRGSPRASPRGDPSPALLRSKQGRCIHDSIGDALPSAYSASHEVGIPATHDLSSDTKMASNSPPRLGVDGTGDDILKYDVKPVENQQPRLEADTIFHEGSKKSPLNSGSSDLGVPSVENKNSIDRTTHSPVVDERRHEKRKVTNMDQISPFVTKRRKRLKPPPALNFSQENRQTQDPTLIGRQHRREVLASRKSHLVTSAAVDVADLTSQKTDDDAVALGDAAQRTMSLPEESAPMELDQLPPDPVAHCTTFDPAESGGNTALPENKLQLRDNTPRNKSVELGDDFQLSLNRPEKVSSLPVAPKPPSPTVSAKSTSVPTNFSLYATFKSTYPQYSGGVEHFSGMCLRIKGLLRAERMEHRSLWDDFVIRHRTDYRDYLLDCTDRGDDPIPYEEFYKHHIDEPIYCKHILTPNTLNDAIASIESTGPKPQPETSLRSPANSWEKGVSIAKASPPETYPQVKAREVIDLILEGPASRSTPATNHPLKLSRSLSWVEAAKVEIDSPTFSSNIPTPKSALTRERSTPVQTPSSEFRRPKQTPMQQTPLQIRNGPILSQRAGPPMATANIPSNVQKSPSPPKTSESNRTTVADLRSSPSDTASPSIPESNGLNREETEEEQWWRDRNTPFKAFTRAYASLKSIDGRMGTVDEEGILEPMPRKLDVLNWKL